MEQVSGNLVLPTGDTVPYAAKTVHTSPFNSEVVMAYKAPKGVDVDVKTGTSVGTGLINSSTAIADGMTFGMATYGALK